MTEHTIHDVSLPISESLAVWPGDLPVDIRQLSHLAKGDNATVSVLTLGAHVGTHVDAPMHFILNGASIDTLNLNVLVGPAVVVNALKAESLTAETLESLLIPSGIDRVLFHTRNSEHWAKGYSTFNKDYVAVTEDGAQWLVSHGIRLVGIDYLSIAPFSNGAPSHRELLKADVVIVEGLDLRGIKPGRYQLVCLPLRIVGVDGAPARAILIDEATSVNNLLSKRKN